MMGPFGDYPVGTPGCVLNALVEREGLPLMPVENFRISETSVKSETGAVAEYKWFNGYEYPVFKFYGDYARFNKQVFALDLSTKLLTPQLRPVLNIADNPSITVEGEFATPEFCSFVIDILDNRDSATAQYRVTRVAAAELVGSSDPNRRYISVEFWRPTGMDEFLQYINSNFTMKAR